MVLFIALAHQLQQPSKQHFSMTAVSIMQPPGSLSLQEHLKGLKYDEVIDYGQLLASNVLSSESGSPSAAELQVDTDVTIWCSVFLEKCLPGIEEHGVKDTVVSAARVLSQLAAALFSKRHSITTGRAVFTAFQRLIVEPLEKLCALEVRSRLSSSRKRAANKQLKVALVVTKSNLSQALQQQLMQLRSDSSHMQPSTHSGGATSAQASNAPASSSWGLKEGQVLLAPVSG